MVEHRGASLQRAPVAGVPYLLALSKSSLNGVLGVECSNHSVPTILFNDLAQPNPLGFFMSKKRPLLGPLPAGNLCLFLLAAIAGLEV